MGYLDDYGEREARREKLFRRIKGAIYVLLVLFVVGGALWVWFKNYRQEQRAKQFLALLQRSDYAAAYTFWGCKVESPCPNYDYKNFMEDWGPSSPVGKVASYRLVRSREQGSGVIVTVAINQRPEIKLWVEKRDGTLSFAPPF